MAMMTIHSFGYKSAMSDAAATIKGVPEFASSLLSTLRDSPAIRHSHNAIVLVGHSMGGLVIKKVCLTVNDTADSDFIRLSSKLTMSNLSNFWQLVSAAFTF